MILLSVEVATGKAALFGFPRNKYNVPLPEDADGQPVNNRTFRDPHDQVYGGMLSAIWQRAYENAAEYFTPAEACPDGIVDREHCLAEARAYRATTGAIQNLAGVQIHGVMSINLNGFVDLVDAVGGVWIDVPEAVRDDNYPREDGTKIRIRIRAGCQKFDGTTALAYARSRHQDSDYHRMERQQLVLQAVRRQFDPISMLPQLPRLIEIAEDNFYTTFDRTELELLARVAARVDADRLYRVTFTGARRWPTDLAAENQVRRMRQTIQGIFGRPQPEPTPAPTDKPDRCPPPGEG